MARNVNTVLNELKKTLRSPRKRRRVRRKIRKYVDRDIARIERVRDSVNKMVANRTERLRREVQALVLDHAEQGIRTLQVAANARPIRQTVNASRVKAKRQAENAAGITRAAVKAFLNTLAAELEKAAKKLK